ncbi:MAG: UDP-glucose 4-epimerase GalE [Chlamydiota bacterium]
MKGHVLVIGGAGYIGSHVCKALAAHGYIPITYDSLVIGHRLSVKWGPFIKGDILDKALLINTLKTFTPIAVFHLASYSNTRQSVLEAPSYYQNNLLGTASVLEALAESPPSYFLFSSSASVYGMGSSTPIKEDSPLHPTHPYGHTKLLSEYMVEGFCKQKTIQYANLRYFNVAGADPDKEIGETHDPETHLIPLLIQVLKKEKDCFPLLNNKHPTQDGTAQRDFIHVSDLAEAHIHALEWMDTYKKNITLNLGSGTGHTILEILQRLENLTGQKIPIALQPRIEEPPSLIADITKATELLNWIPKRSNLDTIIETALNWHL